MAYTVIYEHCVRYRKVRQRITFLLLLNMLLLVPGLAILMLEHPIIFAPEIEPVEKIGRFILFLLPAGLTTAVTTVLMNRNDRAHSTATVGDPSCELCRARGVPPTK